ncbi:WecB/TagA/CpsF family glycosyltransferase [Blastococcus deserti]|uniref:WecB/TagA/CpsF family glycosyltransferase n=1 Tax=Blastococcus deserti TaxID=2259033 RepID=A0ABW4XAL2_9ACTN
MPMTEAEVADHVATAWQHGEGGSILTVNVDILRSLSRNSELAALAEDAEIVVADGMPLVWAASLAGYTVPERVTGASLVSTLAETAAGASRTVYLVGGEPGVPEAAGRALLARFPGLRIAGADSPPFGFENDPQQLAALVDRIAAARPDLVLVGLGFPKQERLIARLRPRLPAAWMLGCGAGIPFAAGQFRRAPAFLQRIGAEWLHRLLLEPRRLARRYLLHDLPFAVLLLTTALAVRVGRSRPLLPPDDALPARQPASR